MPSKNTSDKKKAKTVKKEERPKKNAKADKGEQRHEKKTMIGRKNESEFEFKVKKGDVLAIPTQAIPFYAKYDDATDSSSEYSEPPDELCEEERNGRNRAERIKKTLLSLGFDFDGRLLCDDVLFTEPDQAAAFTPMVLCEKPVEIECICLWDFFSGDTCLDINCWAGTQLNVVAEEYQVRHLSAREHLRLPLRWSLVRNPTSGSRAALGLIPSCWLVAKKFYQENPALFSQSFWYLGICDVDVAYQYLMSDRSAQRPGVFVIFSPLCLNPDPNDYRPFLLMFLCKKTGKSEEILKAERADVTKFRGAEFYSYELAVCNCLNPKNEQIAKEGQEKLKKKKRSTLLPVKAKHAHDEEHHLVDAPADNRVEDDKEKNLDSIAELVASPFTIKMLTITRSLLGHFELFGNRYHTLYDLVYHLSQTDSELPHRLIYETLSTSISHPFCTVPPPCKQPHRDPRANLMHCEQWAARQFDQAVLPNLLEFPFQHVSRTVVDPHKQSHKRILKALGLQDKGKRRKLPVNGIAIQKEINEYIDRFERPVKKEKVKEDKEIEDPATRQIRLQPHEPIEKCPKDEFCIISSQDIEVDSNDLTIDRMHPLGKGAFGAVYAGHFKTQNGEKVPVAVKSLRLVCTDKDQRLPWITEIEMAQQLNHPNIVRFYGFCMEPTDSNILLIFEKLDKGALDTFCRKLNYRVSVNETVDWLCQIARGMAHLHAQEPSIVHGDLAARNVLVTTHPVDKARFIMKLTDLGISKRTRSETFATYDDPNKIPFKWLPPEVLKSREMTPKADVWSYGVLMHEIYGIGEPYGMMGAEKVVHALNDGHRFERQPKMPHFIYDVSLQCWRRLPADRPHFREIELLLRPHYIEYEASHMEILAERYNKEQEALARHLNDSNMNEADLLERL
ncbi:unnamed protein product [Cylicocyclus nassatus]|uniref:Protein kinase domain-containing protein n=1 Tax=Cylicocyclus nassatus TaxID=53992 RepID=A0AA36M1P5_CYLNA|nr:unnamed protein product [Cylicocyclus nassatus]